MNVKQVRSWLVAVLMGILFVAAQNATAVGYSSGCFEYYGGQSAVAPLTKSASNYMPMQFWANVDDFAGAAAGRIFIENFEFSVEGESGGATLVADGKKYKADNRIVVPVTQWGGYAFVRVGLVPSGKKTGEGFARITLKKVHGYSIDDANHRVDFHTGDSKTLDVRAECSVRVLESGLQVDISPMLTNLESIGPLASVKLWVEAGETVTVRGVELYTWVFGERDGCAIDNYGYIVAGKKYAGNLIQNVEWKIVPGSSLEVLVIGRPYATVPGACKEGNYGVGWGNVRFTIDHGKDKGQIQTRDSVIWPSGNRFCASPVIDCSGGVKG